ncbi:MFS transporter [Candidatus Woesearchaeota archaeon CG11_big_fil_rev_8_21_14_0_20_43_8]|nr:MAG: MFS transporter [Candidatus Woesearchaeota archaeon CG11_big_fil_rev_8_21_14_0_20_43_8]PIO05562.1 MAG: MFS transporter [Candidatus Woesearchaeota archaeon CG08_land_8_20_14_0_20_43_7]
MKFSKWYVLVGALIIQMCLGVVYAWSVFLSPLMKEFGWAKTEASVAFTIALVSFAGFMIFAGRLQDKLGPRLIATIGGVLLGLGFILARFTTSLWMLYITYGVIAGAGIGFAYVCPIATLVKWFPQNKGLISGIAVAGFGAGSLVFAPLATSIIESTGWRSAFWILGLIFLVAVVLGAQLLRNPDAAYTKKKEALKTKKTEEIGWQEMLKRPVFWKLWVMFMFGATAGLMVIGHLAVFGREGGLTPEVAAAAVGVLAIFNGLGRIIWGLVSDIFGRVNAMTIMFGVQALMMFLLIKMNTSFWMLAFAVAFVGFNFGGNFALFPSATADNFGMKNMGANYGFMFTSYGFAGILGPMLGAKVFDATQSYFLAFAIAGGLCVIAAILSRFRLAKKHS